MKLFKAFEKADFLSGLCGRDGMRKQQRRNYVFLSGLCGRDVDHVEFAAFGNFLSGLCGRDGYR